MSPLQRIVRPRSLLAVEPEHILVGHGEGVHEDATAALRDAIAHARSRAPAWFWAGLRAPAVRHATAPRYAGGSTFPGFMIPFGSSSCLMPRMIGSRSPCSSSR